MSFGYWLAFAFASGLFLGVVVMLVLIAADTPDPPLPPRVMDRYRETDAP